MATLGIVEAEGAAQSRASRGHALRKAVCVTRLPACDPCVLLRSCPYPFLFESRTPPGAKKLTRYPRTPGPFVLEPADPRIDTLDRDGTLSLGVTLFGAANDHLPYVVHALEQALHERRAPREEPAPVETGGSSITATGACSTSRCATPSASHRRASPPR